jgi:GDP-mannose 6-dehydrogenase
LGKNKEFIDREIPHLDRLLLDTPERTLTDAAVVVVGHADVAARRAIAAAAAGRRIIDLAGYEELRGAGAAEYEGICW